MNDHVIRLEHDGVQVLTYDVKGAQSYTYHIDKHISAELVITYSGTEAHITQTFICEEGANLRVLLRIANQNITLHDMCIVHKDAALTLGYLDLSSGTTIAQTTCKLVETGASAQLMSVCISDSIKHYQFLCEHVAAYTNALIENYAIVRQGGDYAMNACGKIVKGAHDSDTHQVSRVLTLSEQQRSEVTPLLLIDENEVKASHATTLGQPDENQLYYLQTRGLTRKQALGLLTIGYLMPITAMIQDEELGDQLKQEIETKVGLHA